jgi:hypothetical protein
LSSIINRFSGNVATEKVVSFCGVSARLYFYFLAFRLYE